MSLHDFAGRVSVIVPAFNEEVMIGQTILETTRSLTGCDYEVIVVDDGSSDRTYAEAHQAAAANPRVRVLRNERNQGKGSAFRVGFEHCTGDLVALLDADLDLHPRQLHSLYQIMRESGADAVIGSKRHPKSRLVYPWHRRLISTLYFGLSRLLFALSLRDTQTGIKLFRRAVLADAFPRVKASGYAYDLELLVAASRFGYAIAEAPVELTYQVQPGGGIGLRSILAMWWDTLRIFYRASFWKWLSPGPLTKLWMVLFVLGLVAASFGLANAVSFASLPDWLVKTIHYLALKFIPRGVRNLLLIGGGVALVIGSLIQLNKSLMRAFAHADDGDLAGILPGPRNGGNGLDQSVEQPGATEAGS